MSGLTGFLARQLISRNFWFLVLASFTMVFMLAWRSYLKNAIFQEAAGKFDAQRRRFAG
jgi:hypothetical protein